MADNQYSFKNSFLQSFVSLLFDSMGLIAGAITSLVALFVIQMPWILIIYPPLLTVRGNINGIFSGRLTTGLHVGQILPRMRKNTSYFRSLTSSIYFMSFVNAIAISFFAYGMYLLVSPSNNNASFKLILEIVLLSMLIPTSLSIFLITPLVSIFVYKKGADPDVVVYPVMSTVNDIIISATYVGIIYMFIFAPSLFDALSIGLGITFTILFLNTLRYVRNKDFKETIIEGLPTVLVLSIVSNFTGGLLSQFRYQIEKYPHLLLLYPALIDSVGDEGSIISSVFTTKLSLGISNPSIKEIFRKDNKNTIFGTFLAGSLVFILLSIISSTSYFLPLHALLGTIIVVTLTNLILLIPITVISFVSGIATFKYGLNPDNYTIPIISSASDLLTTLVLFMNVILFSSFLV